MKQVLSDRILCIDNDFFDNRYMLYIPSSASSPHEIDMAELLLRHRNDAVDYKKDYKLWNQVYAPDKELALFQEVVEGALRKGVKLHISNVSLREELEIVRKLYLDLGYFHSPTNRFEIDFENAPITIGVNIRNLIYSTKDYKSKREQICFVPPPRDSGHVKSLFAGINSGVVNMISLNSEVGEGDYLEEVVALEKTNLLLFANALYWNYLERWFMVEKKEWILEINP